MTPYLAARFEGWLTPQINFVQFTGSAGNYSLTLKGSGFGSPKVSVPFRGDITNFRIADSAPVGHAEWGYTGDASLLTYASWSDSTIAITSFGGEPCDSVTIAVWNAASNSGGDLGRQRALQRIPAADYLC